MRLAYEVYARVVADATTPHSRNAHHGRSPHAHDLLLPAFVALVKAVELVPSLWEAWNLLGLVAEWLGLAPQAAAALERAYAGVLAVASQQPAGRDVRTNLARALLASGRAQEAHDHCRDVLASPDLPPRHALALHGTNGAALFLLGRLNEAYEQFEQGAWSDPMGRAQRSRGYQPARS